MRGLRCAAMVEFFHHCCVERSSCRILPTWKAWKQHAGNPSGIAESPKSVEGELCESSKLRLPRYCGSEVIVCPRCPPYAVDRLVVLNGRAVVSYSCSSVTVTNDCVRRYSGHSLSHSQPPSQLAVNLKASFLQYYKVGYKYMLNLGLWPELPYLNCMPSTTVN